MKLSVMMLKSMVQIYFHADVLKFIQKGLIIILIGMSFFGNNSGRAQEVRTLDNIRESYVAGVENETKLESLHEYLDRLKKKAPIHTAYLGACEGLLAKHHWNPYKKVAFLKQAGKTLQSAVEEAPQNIEIRFLRFSMQHYIPEFLGQSKELEKDRSAIVKYFNTPENKTLGEKTRQTIARFMIESKRCSAEEERLFKSTL